MNYLICVFFILNMQSKFIFKEKLIGDSKGYNIKATIKLDPSKKTEEISFKHIINQTINFREKQKNIISVVFNTKKMNGYAITGINILNYKRQIYYELELYRSNGSPEIYLIYNEVGKRIIKSVERSNKTQYYFLKKNINSDFFEMSEISIKYDLTDMY